MSVGTANQDATPESAAEAQPPGEVKTTQKPASQVQDQDQQTDDQEAVDDGDATDALAIARYYHERHNRPNPDRFRNDDAWFDHVDQLERTVGQRNEDAILGKKIRERLAEEGSDIEAILGAAPASRQKRGDDLPELRPEWITFDEQGQMRAMPGAPSDVAQRYLARHHLFITQPEKYLQKALGSELQEIKQKAEAAQAEAVQQREQQELAAAVERHRQVLYVGGERNRGMTPLGQKIADRVGRFARNGVEAAEMLDAYVEDLVPKQAKPNNRSVSQRALRQTGIVQASGQNEKELDALLSQGAAGLAHALRESFQRQKAAEI